MCGEAVHSKYWLIPSGECGFYFPTEMDDGAREAEWVLNNLGEMISEFYEDFFFFIFSVKWTFFSDNLGCNHFCNCQWVRLHLHQCTLRGEKKKKKNPPTTGSNYCKKYLLEWTWNKVNLVSTCVFSYDWAETLGSKWTPERLFQIMMKHETAFP